MRVFASGVLAPNRSTAASAGAQNERTCQQSHVGIGVYLAQSATITIAYRPALCSMIAICEWSIGGGMTAGMTCEKGNMNAFNIIRCAP